METYNTLEELYAATAKERDELKVDNNRLKDTLKNQRKKKD